MLIAPIILSYLADFSQFVFFDYFDFTPVDGYQFFVGEIG